MTDKQCAICGEINSPESMFCSNCGRAEFRDIPPGLSARLSNSSSDEANNAVRLGTGRVALLSILSFGLYVFWWFYITWKQLASETREEHFPVWHALTLFVPIYNLFRMHRHVSVINGLAIGVGLTASLSSGLAVVLWALSSGLDTSSLRVSDVGIAAIMGVISVALTTTLIVYVQGTLNQYWYDAKGPNLREARIGIGEVIFVLFGILAWIGTFLPE